MKLFHYNAIVGKEDFADRENDIKILVEANKKGRKTVLYAPRRYGKTSLAKNILPQEFKGGHLYVDFMDCSSLESVAERLLQAYQLLLKKNYKKTYLVQGTETFLRNLNLSFSSDPMTNEASLSLSVGKTNTSGLGEVLVSLALLCEKNNVLLVFDEFQDLYEVKEALAIFRSHLQSLKKTPMLFLGSKRKLLAEIFSTHDSPFFNFGSEYVLKPISLDDWIPFFKERLQPIKTKMENEALAQLCEEALNVPNTVCEIGAFIQDYYQGKVITKQDIMILLSDLIDRKSESYRYQLSLLSSNELKVCKALAQNKFTQNILGKEFTKLTGLGASSTKKVIQKLYRVGIVEEEPLGYRLSNPILSIFLKYRSY